MATYILLSTLTPKGRKTCIRIQTVLQQVNKEIEVLGCKVVNQYAVVVGLCDFVSVVEAPDKETAVQLSVDLGSRGNMMTLPAMTVDELRKMLKELGKK